MKLSRLLLPFCIMTLLLTFAASLLAPLNVLAANPYLPLWEHLPDGEPRVFEDPDNPGRFRVYIIGSHDVRYDSYCGPDIRMWSAPVDDLNNWRDEGPVFTFQDPLNLQWDVMYAPDLVEVRRRDATGARTIKEYYLYPHSRGPGREAMVAKSDRPTGPFEPINLDSGGRRLLAGSVMGFDPAVYIEYVDDPSDPDYDIGFRAYGYWGFQRFFAAELDQETMYTVRPGTSVIDYFIPSSDSYGNIRDPEGTEYPHVFPGEDLDAFNYFEAASVRKVGNKYVLVYSGYSGPDYGLGSTNSSLRYAYGDTPLGPWRSGGVLVDSRAPVPNQDGTALQTAYAGHNTHGGLQQIGDQWYVFYHRAPRWFGYARQPMVAPVHITADERAVSQGGSVTIRAYDPYAPNSTWTAAAGGFEYTGAQVTSEGFNMFGLDPYKYYSAGIACYLSDPSKQADAFDIWDNHAPVTNLANRDIVGYKHFGFGGLQRDANGIKAFQGTAPGNNTEFNLFLLPRTENAFTVNIWIDGPWAGEIWNGTKIGEINVPESSAREVTHFSVDVSEHVDEMDGKRALFLVAEGGSGALFDLIGLGFSADGKPLERNAPPAIGILAGQTLLNLPQDPVRSTNANGIFDYSLFEVAYKLPPDAGEMPTISAFSSNEDVKITIAQAGETDVAELLAQTAGQNAAQNDEVLDMARVVFEYQGVEKTYNVLFTAEQSPDGADAEPSTDGELPSWWRGDRSDENGGAAGQTETGGANGEAGAGAADGAAQGGQSAEQPRRASVFVILAGSLGVIGFPALVYFLLKQYEKTKKRELSMKKRLLIAGGALLAAILIFVIVLVTVTRPDATEAPAPDATPTQAPAETAEPTQTPTPTAAADDGDDAADSVSDNRVMRFITGSPQWEGIRVQGERLGLELGKSYTFTFRLFTPFVSDGEVGFVFQANTDNGWNWDSVAVMEASSLQPRGWYDVTGVLDLSEDRPDVNGLPTLVMTKLGDGGLYDSQPATFFIDDFEVTETDSGAVVFSDDFQAATTPFEGNGGVVALVADSEIDSVFENVRPDGTHALDVPSLKEIYADHFLIGNIVNPVNLSDSATEQVFYEVLKHHYNALTFENDMKPDHMWNHPWGYAGDRYARPAENLVKERLEQVDGWLRTLIDDDFKIIGHTLVWHGQSPDWMNLSAGGREAADGRVYRPYAQARQNMEDFINTVAGHWYNHPDGISIYAWDVINEAVSRQRGYETEEWGYHTIGAIWVPSGEQWHSPWYMCYGTDAPEGVNPWDYVYDAFHYARKADPSTTLYYNDYNMEDPIKVQIVVHMVNGVNLMWAQSPDNPQGSASYETVEEYIEAGGRLLIEGIGMQQHDTVGADTHFTRVEHAIKEYISTGAKVSITELDVGVNGYQRGATLSEADELRQARHYAKLFEIFLRYSDDIERVSFWGLQDARSWRADTLCLIFDPNLNTKLAYYAVADPIGFLAEHG